MKLHLVHSKACGLALSLCLCVAGLVVQPPLWSCVAEWTCSTVCRSCIWLVKWGWSSSSSELWKFYTSAIAQGCECLSSSCIWECLGRDESWAVGLAWTVVLASSQLCQSYSNQILTRFCIRMETRIDRFLALLREVSLVLEPYGPFHTSRKGY